MKIYGNEKTNLVLTEKALKAYSNCDPLRIIEQDDGLYTIEGIGECCDMTAEEVNRWLEEFADETVQFVDDRVTNLTYKEALELNELAQGLDMSILAINDLLNCIEGLPGWDYPLAEDLMNELAKRAGIDPETFFAEHDTDYNGLYQACVEALGIDD